MRGWIASGEEDTKLRREVLQRGFMYIRCLLVDPMLPIFTVDGGDQAPRLPRPVHAGANICSRRMHCPNAVLGMFASNSFKL